eukprot:1009224_1
MAPPEGCSYIFDHYVTNSKGDCCASMCYAVDSDGAKCAVINVENEIDIADPGNEGDLCTDEQKNASDCPIAMCSPAPNVIVQLRCVRLHLMGAPTSTSIS